MGKFLDRVERFLSSHPRTVELLLRIMEKIVVPLFIGLGPLHVHRPR